MSTTTWIDRNGEIRLSGTSSLLCGRCKEQILIAARTLRELEERVVQHLSSCES